MRLNSSIIKVFIFILGFFRVTAFSAGLKTPEPLKYYIDLRGTYVIEAVSSFVQSASGDGSRFREKSGFSDYQEDRGAGLAVGIRHRNFGFALAREYRNMNSFDGDQESVNGLFLWDGWVPFKTKTTILEIDHRRSINDRVTLISLIGVGYSDFHMGESEATVSLTSSEVLFPFNLESKNSDFSYRLGGGVGFQITDTLFLNTILQYTHLGKVRGAMRDFTNEAGGFPNGVRTWTYDVHLMELSARVEYVF